MNIVKQTIGLDLAVNSPKKLTIGYARVSGSGQKDDLIRQEERLMKTIENKPHSMLISDLGSGINFKKKGLQKLISLVISGQVEAIILTHKDRLVRFGFELIHKICTFFGTKIIALDEKSLSFEEELAQDVITIVTVFSAKLYGKRSHSNKNRTINADLTELCR